MQSKLASYEKSSFYFDYFRTFSEDRIKAVALCTELGLAAHKIRHSMVVSDAALLIAKNVEKNLKINIDKRVVELGAVLHDIGLCQIKFEAGKNDFVPEHAYLGAEIALQAGYGEHIARCIEFHDCGGFLKEVVEALGLPKHFPKDNYTPESWEEKIVSYADVIISVEGEAFINVWDDVYGCVRGLFCYLNEVYEKRLGIHITKDHPQFKYLTEFNREMKNFISKEDYETLRYEINRMNDSQREAGIVLPFSSLNEW